MTFHVFFWFFKQWPSHVPTVVVVAPTTVVSSIINSEPLTTVPAREYFLSVCACTERPPGLPFIGAVCVGRGGQTNVAENDDESHTHRHTHAPTPMLTEKL